MKPSIRPSRLADKLGNLRSSHIALPADVVAAAKAICEEFDGGDLGRGIPAVAAKIGMSAGVLYNKLAGVEGSHHKLTVADCQLIFLATGRIEHLQAMARTMNCVAFPVPDLTTCSDEALLDLLAKVHEEGGSYHHMLRHALQDGQIDRGELAELTRQVFMWLGAILEAHNRMKGLARG